MAGEVEADTSGARTTLAALPWRGLLVLDVGLVALLLAVATRYGWHRDELYFLEAGTDHLAWGYIDQPPFTPFVARLADAIAPGNLVVLRTLPALATAVTVALGAATVRELGGSSRAQLVGGVAVAAGGFTLGVGHLLSTAAFDLTAWSALLWVAARLLRTADARWWIAFGAIAGAAMLNKDLVVLLAGVLVVAIALDRRWELLRSPWLVVGGALAVAIALPNLLWQADHGWPQADMAGALSERLAGENRATLLPLQLLFAGPLLIGVLIGGARWLAAAPTARRWRALLWAWPLGLVVTFATGGRPYYVLPLTTVVVLAGVVQGDERGRLRSVTALAVANAMVSIPLSLPVLPPSSARVTANVNEAVAETLGWPELIDQVADVVERLPTGERASVVLLTLTYGEAAAIERFGPSRGLPRAYSPHNAFADFGRPTDDAATVVALRFPTARLAPHFERCDMIGRVDNGLDVETEVQGTPIHVCRGLLRGWAATWEDLRFLS